MRQHAVDGPHPGEAAPAAPAGATPAATAETTVRAGDGAAVVAFAGDLVERAVIATVRDVHGAIAERAFAVTPASGPVRVVHDRLTRLVYGAVSIGLGAATLTGAALVSARGRSGGWLDADPARSRAWAVAHGIVGDRLAEDHPDLDLPVRVRVDDRDVPPAGDALRAAFPDATGRLAVFLHGLIESDRSWDPPRRRRDPDAQQVADPVVLPDVVAELGWTPVRLRFGSGRAIGRNGVETADLLAALVTAWPVPVTEIALIGHSMGGLVARAAIDHGQREQHGWVAQVEHTVALGTPHLGSWLERAASRGTWWLRRIPEAAPLARIIDQRARGIKDLRHGALDDAAWGDGVLDADGRGDLDRPLPAPTGDLPLLDGAVHHLIAGRLTASPSHPVTRLFGDLLVTAGSALGDDGTRRLTGAQVEALEVATDHFGLLRHPAVADHLRTWLA